jgi:hypothetical protein
MTDTRARLDAIRQAVARGSSSSGGPSFSMGIGTVNGASRALFYISVAALVIFVGLVFIHYTMYPIFSFSVGADGIVSMPLPSSVQTLNPSTIPPYDTAFKFDGLTSYGYTLSADVYIQSEFAMNDMYPRVVLYRATTPINSVEFPPSTGTLGTLQDIIPSSNIIVYIDPLINNLYVMIRTDKTTQQTTEPIKNIPVRKAFRLTIALDSGFVEVYIDGKMEQTMPLLNAPITMDSTHALYGPPQAIASAIKISNINYYSLMLPPKTIRILATQPPVNTGIFAAAA